MRIYNAIIVVAAMMQTASADCKIGNATCTWFGESPGCGTTDSHIGGWDEEGRQLSYWTRRIGIRSLNSKFSSLGEDCYNDYGLDCVTGYKRLWCKEEVEPETLECSAPE